MDSINSRLQNSETGEQHRDWKFYKVLWILENFSVIFNDAKLSEETKNKNDTDPNLARNFCSTVFLSKPSGYISFIREFPYDCGPALGESMSFTISLIAAAFNDIFF